jgi:hypothetical protein
MAALGKKFLTINSNLLPETSSFEVNPQMVEKVFQTEAGTTRCIVIRASKKTFTVGWEAQSATHKSLCETFCASPTVSLVFDGVTYTCRARNLKESLVQYSNRYSGSAGLWDISFDLEEI